MLQTIRAKAAMKREGGEGGFTLIELMVVVLIIAVLLAIAIPTFLGAQNKAKDRAAQSSLRNTLIVARTIFADSQSYLAATPAVLLAASQGGLTFASGGSGDSTGFRNVIVSTTATTIVLAAKSVAGDCFYARDDLSGTLGAQFARLLGGSSCDSATLTGLTWASSW